MRRTRRSSQQVLIGLKWFMLIVCASAGWPIDAARGSEAVDRDALRSELAMRVRALCDEVDGQPCDNPTVRASYAALWPLLERWTNDILDRTPGTATAALLAEVKALGSENAPVEATAVQLRAGTHATFVVAPTVCGKTTFFVVARDSHSGRFHTRWAVEALAARHYAKRDALGYWAFAGHGIGDGALVGSVGDLPRSRSGRPRFFVDAKTTPIMGCTFPAQLSIWEWTGNAAVPLLVKDYLVSCDTPSLHRTRNVLSIPTKEVLQVVDTCGECTDPAGMWTVQVTPDGVVDHGHLLAEPEIGLIDKLLSAIQARRTVGALATSAIADMMRERLASHGRNCWGMTNAYSIQPWGDGSVVRVAMDSCCGTEMIFHIRGHGRRAMVTHFECK